VRWMTLTLPLALAACGSGPDRGAAAPSPPLTEVQRRVVALSDGQLRAVLLRSIIDGEEPCQGVVRAKRLPDREGRPTWAARCGNGTAYQVAVGPDGTARVVQLPDATEV